MHGACLRHGFLLQRDLSEGSKAEKKDESGNIFTAVFYKRPPHIRLVRLIQVPERLDAVKMSERFV